MRAPTAITWLTDRRAPLRAAAAICSVLGVGALLTLAAWSDGGTARATFSTGSVDLSFFGTIGVGTETPASYDLASLELSTAEPGSSAVAPLQLTNTGTLPFAYTMTGSLAAGSDEGLGDALRFSVKAGVDPASCTGAVMPSGGDWLVQDQPIDAVNVQARDLAADGAENLCIRALLPLDAPNAAQDQQAAVDFAFTAEQS